MGSPTDSELAALAESVGVDLLSLRWTVATAESCTGGWIAKAMTDIPGSSQWFDCGFVTYSYAAKQSLLGVTAAQLEQHGAVSEVVAAAMAAGAMAAARTRCAVAVSGIAGPGGALPGKPVGTVCFAWALPAGIVTARKVFEGDREDVRRQTVALALERLRSELGRVRGR